MTLVATYKYKFKTRKQEFFSCNENHWGQRWLSHLPGPWCSRLATATTFIRRRRSTSGHIRFAYGTGRYRYSAANATRAAVQTFVITRRIKHAFNAFCRTVRGNVRLFTAEKSETMFRVRTTSSSINGHLLLFSLRHHWIWLTRSFGPHVVRVRIKNSAMLPF